MSKFPWVDVAESKCPYAATDSRVPDMAARANGSYLPVAQARFPSVLESFDDFLALASGKRLVVFLDYDGTLAPIVSNPDMAFMSDEMRSTVKRVGQTFPTAIISGRGRSKVEKFVQLDELFYAGSHGLDIKGPVVQSMNGEEHEALPLTLEGGLLSMMAEVKQEADAAVQLVPGATVEDNTYSVSVHFRNCNPEDWPQVLAATEAIVAKRDAVHMTRGRKVLEIRPRVDWDKGKALLHLLRALGLDGADDVMPLYIGDDRTDEDAFRVLKGFGVGVLVSSIPKATAAEFVLSDPHQVGAFLDRLVGWGRVSPCNAWHENMPCVGWSPTHPDSYPHLSGSGAAAHAPRIPHVSSFCSVSTQAFGAHAQAPAPAPDEHYTHSAPVAEAAAHAISAAHAHDFSGPGVSGRCQQDACMGEMHNGAQLHPSGLWLGVSQLCSALTRDSSQSGEDGKLPEGPCPQDVSAVSSGAVMGLPQAHLDVASRYASGTYATSGITPMSTGEVNSNGSAADSAMQLSGFCDEAAHKHSSSVPLPGVTAAAMGAVQYSQQGVFISLGDLSSQSRAQAPGHQPEASYLQHACVPAGGSRSIVDVQGSESSGCGDSCGVATGSRGAS